MAQYHVYSVDQAGKLRFDADADCLDDAEALSFAARHLTEGSQAEVWRGKVCVGQVCATDTQLQPIAWAVAAGRWQTVGGGFGLSALR